MRFRRFQLGPERLGVVGGRGGGQDDEGAQAWLGAVLKAVEGGEEAR